MTDFGNELARRFGKPLASLASHESWRENQTLELELGGRHTIATVILEEEFATGQRVQKYRLEARRDGVWSTIAEGLTIGRKRIECLKPAMVAEALRLHILSSLPLPKIKRFAA